MPNDRKSSVAAATHPEAFLFVQELATAATRGKIEIPSFPEVAMRIRNVLANDDCDTAQVAKVAGAEPALAAKLLHMANSAALNPHGTRVTELKSAIARIGFSHVRTASLAYAMNQLSNAPALAPIRVPLNQLWERSVEVASLAFVAARSWTRVSADRALLAGLMHGMGKVYILTRCAEHPALFTDQASYHQIVRDWHAPIAKIVLDSWDIAPDIVSAVEHFEELDRVHDGAPDLTDVLAVANVLASLLHDPEALEAQLASASASRRLGITHESVGQVLSDTADELASLHAALG